MSLQLAALEGTDPSGLKGIAIDGKELCGSIDIDTGRRTHLLSAVCHELGVTLACAVSHKTNEIPISRQLLEKFDVKGKVVTTDALLTQRAFCKELIKQKAYYVLRVKKNQKQMYIDIVWVFAPLVRRTPPIKADFKTHTRKQGHTLLKKPRIYHHTGTASTSVSDYIDWPGLAQVYTKCSASIPKQVNVKLLSSMVSLTCRRGNSGRLAKTTPRTLDDRKQIPLGSRRGFRRGCLKSKNRQHPPSHGSFTQHRTGSLTICRLYENHRDNTIFRLKT